MSKFYVSRPSLPLSLVLALVVTSAAIAAPGQISLQARDVTLGELAAQVHSVTGSQVVLLATDPERRVSLEVREVALEELVGALSEYGVVLQTATPAPADDLPRTAVTMRLHPVSAGDLATLLARHLAGSGYQVSAPQPDRLLDLEVEDADLAALLESLERSGILEIARP